MMHGKIWSRAAADAALTRPGSCFEIETVQQGNRALRVWKCAPATVPALLARAERFGAREFLIYDATRVTYDAFLRAVQALAADLKAHGVVPGQRVGLAMRNLPEWPVAFFAILQTGALVVPLNAWWTEAELAAALADSGAEFAIVDDTRLGRLPAQPGLDHVWVCGASRGGAGVSQLEAVIGPAGRWHMLPRHPQVPPPLEPDSAAAIFYTSGTASRPRGVLCSQSNLLDTIMAMAYTLARTRLCEGGALPDADFLCQPQRSMLLTVPLFHVIGACAVMIPALHSGARLVLMPKWDTEAAFALIEAERVSHLWGVPAIARAMLDHPARQSYDLTSLRLISYGGAPFAPALAGEIARVFAPAVPGSGWGMTETASLCIGHSGREYLDHPASCGLPPPTCAIKVTDAAGHVLPSDTVGELWAYGPNVAMGYWQRPEESAVTFVDGWVRTGDLARIDAEGFCTIVGRTKDMLIRGGENIFCGEVEAVLASHPAVREAALLALPDPKLGEVPAAVVVLRQGASASAGLLKAYAAERLAAFKVPVKIVFSSGLPRNAAGKLTRSGLKSLLEQTAETS